MASNNDGFTRVTSAATSVWRGLGLQTTIWEPTTPIKAILYVAHGVSEHMGRYDELGQHLATSGILMYGHDHVGHGHSEGDRVHIEDFNVYVQDVIKSVKQMKEKYSSLPSFLMGHSMGGLVAGLVAIGKQDLFNGLILSAPLVEIDPKAAGSIVQFLARAVALFVPQAGMKSLILEEISSIPEEVQRYADDPLMYLGAMKAKWAVECMNAISRLRQNVHMIQLPALILHGTEDHLIPIAASDFVVTNMSNSDVQFEKFDGSRHEVLHDLEQERVRKTISDWILDRV